MDQNLKQKWIEALRSGKYEQGVGKFYKDGKYCCLGVLCEVAGIPTILRDGSSTGNWPGVDNLIVTDIHERVVSSITADLASRNDSGYSFNEIADYIETNL